MTDNNNGEPELSTSLINQSEAGPEIVQIDGNMEHQVQLRNNIDVNETNTAAIEVMDKVMNLKQPVNIVAPLQQVDRGSAQQQQQLEVELGKLHQMLEKQEKLTQQRVAESEKQLAMQFNQRCSLQDKVKDFEDRERGLVQKLMDQERSQEQLTVVMQEYEMLIGKLTAEVEADKKLKNRVDELMSEKESALVHLNNVEAAFSDVHSKYEKCKKVVEEYKRNEVKLKNAILELSETVRVKEKTLESVQAHAGHQLDAASRELDNAHREHDQELTRLNAMLRKTELKVISLQEALDQKIKENQELTTICDDLIAGRGYNRHN